VPGNIMNVGTHLLEYDRLTGEVSHQIPGRISGHEIAEHAHGAHLRIVNDHQTTLLQSVGGLTKLGLLPLSSRLGTAVQPHKVRESQILGSSILPSRAPGTKTKEEQDLLGGRERKEETRAGRRVFGPVYPKESTFKSAESEQFQIGLRIRFVHGPLFQ
jgi:hypothetical protein